MNVNGGWLEMRKIHMTIITAKNKSEIYNVYSKKMIIAKNKTVRENSIKFERGR